MSGCLMCWTNQRVPRKTFQANGTSPRFSPFLNFSCLCHKVYALELRHWSVATSENHFTIALTSEKLRPHFFYRSGKQSMFMGFYRPFFALINLEFCLHYSGASQDFCNTNAFFSYLNPFVFSDVNFSQHRETFFFFSIMSHFKMVSFCILNFCCETAIYSLRSSHFISEFLLVAK